MKRFIGLMLSLCLCISLTTVAFANNTVTQITWGEEISSSTSEAGKEAQDNKTKPYLALGKDLSAAQLATVMELLGLSGTDLSSYNVVYVTNEEEHQYLGSYIDSAIIGTRSLSSVLVRPAAKGTGIKVATKNINYCTTGMYQNALLTAGVTDAEIIVAAPTQISGTAALIGALKAYAEMTDSDVSEEALDTSLNELVTTGELEESIEGASSEEVEGLIAFIKAQLNEKKLDTREDIESAVRKAVKAYQDGKVELSEEEVQKIVDIMVKIKDLGLDYGTLLDEAAKLYKDGKLNTENVQNLLNGDNKVAIAGAVVKSFFVGLANNIKDFFTGLFK